MSFDLNLAIDDNMNNMIYDWWWYEQYDLWFKSKIDYDMDDISSSLSPAIDYDMVYMIFDLIPVINYDMDYISFDWSPTNDDKDDDVIEFQFESDIKSCLCYDMVQMDFWLWNSGW